MCKQLFLFGTGKISGYYTTIIQSLAIEITGYVDNDIRKCGKFFGDIEIYYPNILKEVGEFLIIIACSDVKTITEQLSQMGMQDRIITMGHIMMEETRILKNRKKAPMSAVTRTNKERTVVIDNLDGVWGGAEDWVHKLAESLLERGYNIIVIENMNSEIKPELEQVSIQVNNVDEKRHEVYRELVEILLSIGSFTLFNVWNSEVLWASSYVKSMYLEDIHIISCILNDNAHIYNRQHEWEECIDLFFCISSRIKDNLKNLYEIDEKKLYCRVPFIENVRSIRKKYQVDNNKPLKIGYPCRLSYGQKRADLLPDIIEKMEKRSINYILNIAGDGECGQDIKKYISDNKLYDKVKFHGKLLKKELIDFLNEQDIYLNFSEYEGTSLTMLEAMASGCVPVVTDVSGVSDFIEDGVNGLVSDIGDLDGIVNDIFFLYKNREKIEEYGIKSADIVSHKCKINDYINYVEKIIIGA